jgi:rubrerythrin
MARKTDIENIHELLYQALETELGGIKVYEAALSCALNEDLKKEWRGYLEETRTHREVMLSVLAELGLDPEAQTPGRKVVAHIGESLVKAMALAKASAPPQSAELVAAECVVLAETKDHANWELIGHCAKRLPGPAAAILQKAHDAVEKDEDHHLYHTKGWSRELWIASLGFPAVLPPPEEVRQVESAIGAAHAKQFREQILGAKGPGNPLS